MVVWLKPCESRSSPGFTPKTPLLMQRGFSLCAGNAGSAGRGPATPVDPRHAWMLPARNQGANQGWQLPMAGGSTVDPRHARMLSARNQGANHGWPLPTAGPRRNRLPGDPRDAWMPLCGTTAPTTMGRYRRDPSRRTRKKRRRPVGAVFTWIVLKAEIRRPEPHHVIPAGGTPTLHRPAFPPATAARVLRQLLPPPAQHSAAWPGPSAPRSG